MGLAITAATNIRRQLDTIGQDLKKGTQVEAVVESSVQTFSDKFRALEEKVVPKEFGSTLMTRELALRGGSLNQLILMLGMSISGFPSAPTKTDLFQINEIKQLVDDLVGQMNRTIREDIPALNKVLEQNKIQTLKAPEEVKL
jgi:hypothetical protein